MRDRFTTGTTGWQSSTWCKTSQNVPRLLFSSGPGHLGKVLHQVVPGWHVLSKRERLEENAHIRRPCLLFDSFTSSIVTIMAPTEAFHDLEFAMLERNEGKVISSIEALQKDSIHSGE